MATAKKKTVKLTKKESVVYVLTVKYDNLMPHNGIATPYLEDVLYCPTATSIPLKLIDSLQYRLDDDDELFDFLFENQGEEFHKLIAKAVSLESEPALFTSPYSPKTTISVCFDKVLPEHVDMSIVGNSSTVNLDANFIELTAVIELQDKGLGQYDEDGNSYDDETYSEEYRLTYIRADSIIGVSDSWADAATMNFGLSEPISLIGSEVHTNCPSMKSIKVRECPALVLAKIRAVALARSEHLAGTK